jgi:hypothetical protein
MVRRTTAAPLSVLGLLAGLSLGCGSESMTGVSESQAAGTPVINGGPEVFPGPGTASSVSQSRSVGQSQSSSIGQSQSRSVGQSQTQSVGQSQSRSVGQSQSQSQSRSL